ncbi:MAG: DUF4336 domain-containing protein [Vulcanimicrobiaceae bacterium]
MKGYVPCRRRSHVFQRIDDRIWTHAMTVRFGGIPMPHRMTVIRLEDGGLFVHSPTKLDSSVRENLDALGEVRYVVAPSWWHDMFLREYVDAYPSAKLYGAPTLVKWHRSLPFAGVLGAESPPWGAEIDQFYVDRMRLFLDEFVFFHRVSRSLIVADLAFNLREDAPPSMKWYFKAVGAYPGCAIPWFYRLAPQDRTHMRASIEFILSWDIERLIVGHGDVAPNGKAALRNAYRWLLGP